MSGTSLFHRHATGRVNTNRNRAISAAWVPWVPVNVAPLTISLGVATTEAARQVGAHIRTANDWDHGMRRSDGLRLDTDGRIMGYNTDVTNLNNRRTPLVPIEQYLDPRSLSRTEREHIRDPMATGPRIGSIATAFQRSPSTISRALLRNGLDAGTCESYGPHRRQSSTRPKKRS